jgi:hypothetical protein
MAVTIARQTQTYDAATDTMVTTTSTITGSAVLVKGDPLRYQALGLVESAAPTLLFSPASYGLKAFTDQFVQPGDTVDWLGTTYTVRDVQPTAPDGYVIVARLVVSR